MERELVGELLEDGKPRVVALGGGTLTLRSLRHRVLDAALLVTLTASPAETMRRLGHLGSRPMLAGRDSSGRVRELLESRADAYAEAHLTLDTEGVDPEVLADAVVALVDRDPLLVPLGRRTYTVDLVRDVPAALTDALARLAPSSVVAVTDTSVLRARGASMHRALEPLALRHVEVTLPAGEPHKNLTSVQILWDAALGAEVDRDTVVLAFGGGVVGDLAGFAAATLLRGVRYVQAPTTLLAMLDASVGGKTGFDHPAGKNLVGAFHQPSAVVIDLAHLATLPARETRAGLAEAVKVAVGLDASLLDLLEAHAEALAAGTAPVLAEVVRASVAAKARVVRDDELDRGRRAVLNLGHTVGHALEAHGRFADHLHGEAVAVGLVAEMRACAVLGMTPAPLADRVERILGRMGLETSVDAATLESAFRFVGADKKRTAAGGAQVIGLPVVTGPGTFSVARVESGALRRALGVGSG